jgi:hypothetical protein
MISLYIVTEILCICLPCSHRRGQTGVEVSDGPRLRTSKILKKVRVVVLVSQIHRRLRGSSRVHGKKTKPPDKEKGPSEKWTKLHLELKNDSKNAERDYRMTVNISYFK